MAKVWPKRLRLMFQHFLIITEQFVTHWAMDIMSAPFMEPVSEMPTLMALARAAPVTTSAICRALLLLGAMPQCNVTAGLSCLHEVICLLNVVLGLQRAHARQTCAVNTNRVANDDIPAGGERIVL